jgi:pimeloyl-ACP methyl ester carboxylesterase
MIVRISSFPYWLLLLALPAFLFSNPLVAQNPAPKIIHTTRGTVEVGSLGGALYRIDVPSDWNHSLVIYFHGYSLQIPRFKADDPVNSRLQPFLDRHYAVIQSAYSQWGWAVERTIPETEAVRLHFLESYGRPLETYLTGLSMGGLLTSLTLEQNPQPYVGGLDFCGAVVPSAETFDRRFAEPAAFGAFFPGVMPPLVPSPVNYQADKSIRDKITAALHNHPSAAVQIRSLIGLHSEADVIDDIAFFTFVITDVERRSGGNPFDNVIYTGTGSITSDADLNAHVQRYAADPQSREYLLDYPSLTGNLGRPMLAVHTLYDPLIPTETLSIYEHEVEAAGAGDKLAWQFVPTEGHCNFSPEKIGQAFDELARWVHKGPRPEPGEVRDPN